MHIKIIGMENKVKKARSIKSYLKFVEENEKI